MFFIHLFAKFEAVCSSYHISQSMLQTSHLSNLAEDWMINAVGFYNQVWVLRKVRTMTLKFLMILDVIPFKLELMVVMKYLDQTHILSDKVSKQPHCMYWIYIPMKEQVWGCGQNENGMNGLGRLSWVIYWALKWYLYEVAKMLQASWGRSGKEQQELHQTTTSIISGLSTGR